MAWRSEDTPTRVRKATGAALAGQPGVCSSRSKTLPRAQRSGSARRLEKRDNLERASVALKKPHARTWDLTHLPTRNRMPKRQCCDVDSTTLRLCRRVSSSRHQVAPVCREHVLAPGSRPRPRPALLMAAASPGAARRLQEHDPKEVSARLSRPEPRPKCKIREPQSRVWLQPLGPGLPPPGGGKGCRLSYTSAWAHSSSRSSEPHAVLAQHILAF